MNTDFENDTDTVETQQTLHELAKQIITWRKAQVPALTEAQMLDRFPALSSIRTLHRFRDLDFRSIDLTKKDWVEAYAGVLAQMEADSVGDNEDPIYADLGPARRAASAVASLLKQKHPRQRVIILEGDTGTGKTSALKVVQTVAQRAKAQVVIVQGNVTWESSLGAMLQDLCEGISGEKLARDKKYTKRDLWLKLLSACGERKVVVLIDEGHRMTGEGHGFNAIIDLVNCTNCFFGIAAVGTIWSRMVGQRWQEAKQLTHNRCDATVTMTCPDAADVKRFLERRVPGLLVDLKSKEVLSLTEAARTRGNYAFIRRVSLLLSGVPEEDLATDGLRLLAEATAQAASKLTKSRS